MGRQGYGEMFFSGVRNHAVEMRDDVSAGGGVWLVNRRTNVMSNRFRNKEKSPRNDHLAGNHIKYNYKGELTFYDRAQLGEKTLVP